MQFSLKKILVVGLGKSGLSVCRYLRGQGALVTASEFREKNDLDRACLEEMVRLGVTLETGGHREETFLASEMIVVSPGVPLDIGPLRAARAAGIPVLGEMELASRLLGIPMAAITGTNGKSTVTALLGHMMEKTGRRVFVGGNLGNPLMDYVSGTNPADLAVVEVSSFQLDTIERFHPALSMILNISPDHLDRYPDYEAYAASKCRIFMNQVPGDVVILNDDDPRLARVRPDRGVTVLRYGMKNGEHRQAFLDKGRIVVRLPDREPLTLDPSGFGLSGGHNLQNLLACLLAGLALDATPGALREGMDTFRGLAHRMQWVAEIRGVDFYDDSKATNVDAAVRAVEGFDRPLILIAGGRDKGGDYGPLVEAARDRIKSSLLLGEAAPLLEKALRGIVPVRRVESMEEGVRGAFAEARPGDVVLLAPACSSFDMFTDYAQRGMVFQKAVEKLRYGR